ncbi:MAG: class I SAM-dependent methyltransferase [Vicinamibacterales bacterium]
MTAEEQPVRLRRSDIALGARLLRATRVVDTAARLFDRLRSRLVVSLASDRFLHEYNDLAYGKSDRYVLSASDASLMPWEDEVVERFFPKSPARLLIGGAGGGREVFALARRGYEIVAFDPSPLMVSSMAAQIGCQPILAFRARFETLPLLESASTRGRGHDSSDETRPASDCAVTNLSEMGRFDAALLGLTSFSHLRYENDRIKVLAEFARVTAGPIVLSFFHAPAPGAISPHRSKRRGKALAHFAAGRLPAPEGDRFSIGIGYYHTFRRDELERLFERASLSILHLDLEANWSHAVVIR